MQRTLMIDMTHVDEDTVEAAVDYLMEAAEDMLEEGVDLVEVLVALGQAAGHVIDKIESRGALH